MPLTLCIARLRERTRFTRPLFHILDSFYTLLSQFIKNHPEYNYTYYNITFDGSMPVKNKEAVNKSDVIVIPSEQEFHYHIPGYFHSLQMAKSAETIKQLSPYVSGKRLILLRSDRADNETLYRTCTFPNIDFKWRCIDEMDFVGGLHGLKYHFIKKWRSETSKNGLLPVKFDKCFDFAYWGSIKNKIFLNGKLQDSGDVRHKILKEIYKSDLSGYWIGRFTSGMIADMKMSSMIDILPKLLLAKSTLCFNWMDPKATTSRYHEAAACDVFPFVWQNYDVDNTLVVDDWQRVNDTSEFVNKVKTLQNTKVFNKRISEIKEGYQESNIDQFNQVFDKLMIERIHK